MFGKIVLALSALALASAQIPSLGFCPEYVPMANFDMNRFLGVWYEAERYFQLTEVVSRCVMANYTLGPDGKFRVSNEVTNRFTGIKRILEGEIKKAASKAEEGKLHVKYTIPLTPETKYSVLETDYDSYAVLWSCSGIGPFHTQNAWVMTRQRVAPGTILQKAYGVLDKYKISKTFFVKTDQDDCAYLDAIPAPTKPIIEKPSEAPASPEPAKVEESSPEAAGHYRTAVVPDAPAIIAQTKNVEKAPLPEIPVTVEKVEEVAQPVETVPERILKVADAVKEEKPIDTLKEEKMAAEKKEEKVIEEKKEEKLMETVKDTEKTA